MQAFTRLTSLKKLRLDSCGRVWCHPDLARGMLRQLDDISLRQCRLSNMGCLDILLGLPKLRVSCQTLPALCHKGFSMLVFPLFVCVSQGVACCQRKLFVNHPQALCFQHALYCCVRERLLQDSMTSSHTNAPPPESAAQLILHLLEMQIHIQPAPSSACQAPAGSHGAGAFSSDQDGKSNQITECYILLINSKNFGSQRSFQNFAGAADRGLYERQRGGARALGGRDAGDAAASGAGRHVQPHPAALPGLPSRLGPCQRWVGLCTLTDSSLQGPCRSIAL